MSGARSRWDHEVDRHWKLGPTGVSSISWEISFVATRTSGRRTGELESCAKALQERRCRATRTTIAPKGNHDKTSWYEQQVTLMNGSGSEEIDWCEQENNPGLLRVH
jgi:hypothetical protein